MRNYLHSTNGEDRSTKEQIIISSVKEAEKYPVSQNAILQLIPPPIITNDLNKGKGIIFGYYTDSSSQPTSHGDRGPKLMSAAISAGCSSNVQSQEHGRPQSVTSLTPYNIKSSRFLSPTYL